jgi:hypothetical protein
VWKLRHVTIIKKRKIYSNEISPVARHLFGFIERQPARRIQRGSL